MNKKILVVDGQNLNLNRCGGAGRYGLQLYKRLVTPSTSQLLNEFEVHLPNFQDVENINGSQLPPSSRKPIDTFKHIVARSCPPFLFDRLQKLYNSGRQSAPAQSVQIPSWTELAVPSILHEMSNYFMLDEIGRICASSKLALVVTFLDIQDYYYPEYFDDYALRSRRLAYSFYKDRADYFLAISEFTKQTMVERLGIMPEKIKVTHLAADDMLIMRPSKETVALVKSYGRYWIYPAKAWKHKNHIFLLTSLGMRKKELKRVGVKLMLTGGFSEEDNRFLGKLILENNLSDIVDVLGFVSDEHLQALLKGAEYLVFPSLFEGFGMPVLEAMTLGCPVLSSNAGSLPEVGGNAALYFDPKNEDEFIALIDTVLNLAQTKRNDMITKGFENSKRFSWEKTYAETVSVYKELF